MACLTLLARFWHASTALNRPVSPRTVVTPALHARAISRHDFPSARRAETKSRLKIAFGLPTALPLRVPCALARTQSCPNPFRIAVALLLGDPRRNRNHQFPGRSGRFEMLFCGTHELDPCEVSRSMYSNGVNPKSETASQGTKYIEWSEVWICPELSTVAI